MAAWTAQEVDDLYAATKRHNRQVAEALTERLINRAACAQEPQPVVEAERALEALRGARYFDLLQRLADTLMQGGQQAAVVQKFYAQALIDLGALTAAMKILKDLVAEAPDDPVQLAEARALLGRAAKQAYVNGAGATPYREALMREAISRYYDVYDQDRDAVYQGINAVALLARAKRDGIDVSAWPDENELARSIRARALALKRDAWDYAIAGEASVALREWDQAVLNFDLYLRSDDVDAFAIAGSLRQLVEVWQLGTPKDPGSELVLLLRANLLRKDRGSVAALDAPTTLAEHDRLSAQLQAILGTDRYQPLGWYRDGLERSLSVARIGPDRSTGIGTGFMMPGGLLHSRWSGKSLLVTNAHVLHQTLEKAVRPTEAVVTFESLDGGAAEYSINEILWTSPPDELDVTIATLDRDVDGIKPMPMANALPVPTDPYRVYVIGHPRGGTLSFSLIDNELLGCNDRKVHYRAPTEGGSSGSPVFNRQWKLLALHHAGGTNMRRLSPPHEMYAANEGIYIGAIVATLKGEFG